MMRIRTKLRGVLLFAIVSLSAVFPALARQSGADQQTAPANPPANPKKKAASDPADKGREAQEALDHAVSSAGSDRAALQRNLEDFLEHYPDSAETASVYRALVETSQQLHDYPRALEYSEKLIAIQPDNTEMMMLAVGLLEKLGDSESLKRGIDYVDRVLDRTEKLLPDDRPARESLDEWKQHQDRLLVALYMIRGRMEMEQKSYPLAIHDLTHSYEISPNAPAAEKLGEIAELQHRLPEAIQYYSDAFSLSQDSSAGTVDRELIRKKLGNVWRQVHGSEAGLGDELLSDYDRINADAAKQTAVPQPNQNAKDFFSFTLTQLDGKPLPLSSLRGKVLVFTFWATWCGPCREMEPYVEQTADRYADSPNVAFYAVNVDEDRSRVPDFVQRQKMKVPVLFADGLDNFLGMNNIPTVVVVDQSGKVVYSAAGADTNFGDHVTAAIDQALKPSR